MRGISSSLLEADGKPLREDRINVSAPAHTWAQIPVDYAPVSCKLGAHLNCRLEKDGHVYAMTQHDLPFTPVSEPLCEVPAVLSEDGLNIIAEGEGFRYTFSKHDGAFTSLIVNGREQLADKMTLTAFRAPTDNDRKIKKYWAQPNDWQSEHWHETFHKTYEVTAAGNVITARCAIGGISRIPAVRYTQTACVFADGRIALQVDAHVREGAYWLPRLGFETALPDTNASFSYYGRGPWENYCDMHHAAPVGLYESTAEREYVPYVRPQEHGNHTKVTQLTIGDLQFNSRDGFECCVSQYGTMALYRAEHTDELHADGKTHLRIDYRVSGIGSNSCGPELAPRYRVSEKEIRFGFTIRKL